MSKRKLNQEIKEIVHILMDTMQKQDKAQDTQQVLSSFEQEHSVILAQKVEKQSKSCTFDAYQREIVEKDEVKNLESCENEAMSMNDEEIKEGNGDGWLGIGPRERLKKHRKEVAGQVWIPDIWGQEDLLKDWIDCSTFDKCLMSHSIMSARASLIEKGRRANSTSLSVKNGC